MWQKVLWTLTRFMRHNIGFLWHINILNTQYSLSLFFIFTVATQILSETVAGYVTYSIHSSLIGTVVLTFLMYPCPIRTDIFIPNLRGLQRFLWQYFSQFKSYYSSTGTILSVANSPLIPRAVRSPSAPPNAILCLLSTLSWSWFFQWPQKYWPHKDHSLELYIRRPPQI